MGILGRIRDEDAELLLAGRAPTRGGAPFEEVASFVDALRAAVPAPPDQTLESSLVQRLAETAWSASAATTVETAPIPTVRAATWRPRLALAASVAMAVVLVPVVMAGLAFAGVTLPEPVRSVFEDVGLQLPNQPDEDDSSTGANENVGKEGAASQSSGSDSGSDGDSSGNAEHVKHGRRADRRGHGNGGGHGNGQGQGTAGSQGAGGGPAGVPPGQGGIPPGQGGTPPGQAATPPGQGGTPPGQGGAIPGSGSGGQSAEPHGSAPGDVPPGQAKPK